MRIAYEGERYLCSSHVGELLTGEENSWYGENWACRYYLDCLRTWELRDQEKMEQEPQYLYSQQSLDRSLNHAVCSDTVQPTSDRQGNILCLYGT
jgi:hypothetical protein